MALKRKQIITGLSVVYLLALTGLAAYALYSANTYSLPIPNALCALTMALPPLAGIALEMVLSFNEALAKKGQLQTSRMVQTVVAAFLVLESVLATLAGTHHTPPGTLNCALGETWQELWSERDAESVRRIQDTFSCCGFGGTTDRAWPFQDAEYGADACMVRYGREQRCLEPWREEERKVAIMLLVVPIAVFLWKVAILLAPSSESIWLPSQIQLPEDDGDDERGPSDARKPRAAIMYSHLEDGGEDGASPRGNSLQRAVTGLNQDSHLASHVEGNRKRTAGLWEYDNRLREGRADP